MPHHVARPLAGNTERVAKCLFPEPQQEAEQQWQEYQFYNPNADLTDSQIPFDPADDSQDMADKTPMETGEFQGMADKTFMETGDFQDMADKTPMETPSKKDHAVEYKCVFDPMKLREAKKARERRWDGSNGFVDGYFSIDSPVEDS